MSDSIQNQTITSAPPAFSPDLHEQSVRRKTASSEQRWHRAMNSLAGGVSTALRRSARPYPLFFKNGCGAQIADVDGNTYLDYSLGWGPNILGNAPRQVTEAIRETVVHGLTFGAQH